MNKDLATNILELLQVPLTITEKEIVKIIFNAYPECRENYFHLSDHLVRHSLIVYYKNLKCHYLKEFGKPEHNVALKMYKWKNVTREQIRYFINNVYNDSNIDNFIIKTNENLNG